MHNPDAVTLFVDPKESELYSERVGDYPADLYIERREGKANIIVWTDEENGLIFWISAHLPGEELIKIAESVEMTME